MYFLETSKSKSTTEQKEDAPKIKVKAAASLDEYEDEVVEIIGICKEGVLEGNEVTVFSSPDFGIYVHFTPFFFLYFGMLISCL